MKIPHPPSIPYDSPPTKQQRTIKQKITKPAALLPQPLNLPPSLHPPSPTPPALPPRSISYPPPPNPLIPSSLTQATRSLPRPHSPNLPKSENILSNKKSHPIAHLPLPLNPPPSLPPSPTPPALPPRSIFLPTPPNPLIPSSLTQSTRSLPRPHSLNLLKSENILSNKKSHPHCPLAAPS